MIIRRRHTANFTTIGNTLFNDDRLLADEMGVLAWLLSRPHDWEVRRPQLRSRFKIGRETMRRIIRKLICLGWVVARVTRLSDGRVHVLYEVRDGPGPELSEEEAKAALQLVSSGAAPGEQSDDEGSDEDASQAEADPGGGSPDDGPRGADSRPPQAAPRSREDSLKTDSLRTESTKGARAFSDVKSAWPPENILSLAVCEGLHEDMTDTLKEVAFQGIEPYLADCKNQNRKVCDLATYQRERRWERFSQKAKPAFVAINAKDHPAQCARWRTYMIEQGQSVEQWDKTMQAGGSRTVPSEWPPPKGQSEAAA